MKKVAVSLEASVADTAMDHTASYSRSG